MMYDRSSVTVGMRTDLHGATVAPRASRAGLEADKVRCSAVKVAAKPGLAHIPPLTALPTAYLTTEPRRSQHELGNRGDRAGTIKLSSSSVAEK